MGGRGGSGSRGMKLTTPLVELSPTKQMKITNVARDTFNSSYAEARYLINRFGQDNSLAVQPVFDEKRGHIGLHSLRGIQALINSERKNLDIDAKLGVSDKEKINNRTQALDAVQRGLNYYYKKLKGLYWK